MSEYQYYEFQAVDRPLTPEQISDLRAYSSRAQITASSFIVVYNSRGTTRISCPNFKSELYGSCAGR
jgi:hypothetical protein